MASFFKKLYKYKQSDSRHQKENFLTEILAHSLTTDKIFQNRFLILINYNEKINTFNCQTQISDDEFGKPDIFITINDDTSLIVECKIDALQEETQLKRYEDILLKNSSKHKYLIFLTKYFEETQIISSYITFKHIRWYNIFELLDGSTNEISKELFYYLIEEKMSTKISFTKSELSAIKGFQETLAKMDEFLDLIKDTLYSYTDSKIRYLKHIEYGHYGIVTDFHKGKLWLGFYQYEDNDEMQLSISIEDVPSTNSNFKEMDDYFKLLNWKIEENEMQEKRTWFTNINLSTFFNYEIFDSNKARDFLEQEIEKIKRWL